MYHCFMHPNLLNDVNGQYPGMDGKIHQVDPGHSQYQNIPAWDEHRSHAPLMAILAPDQASDVMRSLVNYAQQDRAVRPEGGGLPRWEQVNCNSGGMVGDGDDTIIATSYAFGATQFDTKGAWEAMDRGASLPDVTSDGRKVRGGLPDYLSKGYVPENAAVTLEYCTDDFSNSHNRVGGGLSVPVLPHHRTYSSYPAVSFNLLTVHISQTSLQGQAIRTMPATFPPWPEGFSPVATSRDRFVPIARRVLKARPVS
jgi:hypothetical protein